MPPMIMPSVADPMMLMMLMIAMILFSFIVGAALARRPRLFTRPIGYACCSPQAQRAAVYRVTPPMLMLMILSAVSVR
jgi:hypothetical protein